MTIGLTILYIGPFLANLVSFIVAYLSHSTAVGATDEVRAACQGFIIILDLLSMLAILSLAAEKTSILPMQGFYTLLLALILFLFAYYTHRLLTGTSAPLSSPKHKRKDLNQFLPRFQYSLKEGAESASAVDDYCVVCWERYKDDQWCRSLPRCKHVFHQKCIDMWLVKVSNCPICRARVRLRRCHRLGLEREV